MVARTAPTAKAEHGNSLARTGANLKNGGWLWAGYGLRSELDTHPLLAQWLNVEVVSLRLVDQRFYHLDTCLWTESVPEHALYGASLGVDSKLGASVRGGHRHHLRAINTIRRYGGIRSAVEHGVLTNGIFYECVQRQVPFVLAGAIRDDGPLPDTLMDLAKAQEEYARHIHVDVQVRAFHPTGQRIPSTSLLCWATGWVVDLGATKASG